MEYKHKRSKYDKKYIDSDVHQKRHSIITSLIFLG